MRDDLAGEFAADLGLDGVVLGVVLLEGLEVLLQARRAGDADGAVRRNDELDWALTEEVSRASAASLAEVGECLWLPVDDDASCLLHPVVDTASAFDVDVEDAELALAELVKFGDFFHCA